MLFEVRTPPSSQVARLEAGFLLRRLQQGESLGMPQSRSMQNMGVRCHELRIKDAEQNWRGMYCTQYHSACFFPRAKIRFSFTSNSGNNGDRKRSSENNVSTNLN
ncbi:MAG: type II toxin-antitoxin system RelE/ParE family toxin [Cyanobacteria bacterium P01_H01_bin.119]